MVKITISDLYPSDDQQFINDLTVWEIKTVYAGLAIRSGGNGRPVENTPQEQTIGILPEAQADLDRWMSNVEFQIRDLRKQLGLSQ